MEKKIETFLTESSLVKFTNDQKKIMNDAIKNGNAIIFIGGARVGKTYFAKLFQDNGITAYAPEMICEINLGGTEVRYWEKDDYGVHCPDCGYDPEDGRPPYCKYCGANLKDPGD